MTLRGVVPSPNIWNHTDTYELENLGVDPDGVIEAAMQAIRPWTGARVVDIGCGTGFHLPRFARGGAAAVTGVEPHPPLLAAARRRVQALGPDGASVRVLHGAAGDLPVEDGSVDVAHARWAYFFGPGCEPGLAELERVMARGGTAFVIDNDATRSTFGSWFRRAYPDVDPDAVERFWSRRGWKREPLDIRWEQPDRETFEAVVRIEFAAEWAERFLAEHSGTTVDYAVNLYHRTY
ncbi:MAG TPA: class I SAM-dependent methyltransferase [Actinomycetales bacterium]|nr:class I SAM-dependent methyltransferase [Actinomycetales bacterium]